MRLFAERQFTVFSPIVRRPQLVSEISLGKPFRRTQLRQTFYQQKIRQ
jgi:hypothetical protein